MAKVFREIISASTSQGFQMGLDLHLPLHHRLQMEDELKEANELTGSPHIIKTLLPIHLNLKSGHISHINRRLLVLILNSDLCFEVCLQFCCDLIAGVLACSCLLAAQCRRPYDSHEPDFREHRGHPAPVVSNRRRGKGGVPGKMS